ncbi:MAG: DNA topoisomerase IV subunit A [Myxococcota bacterium]|nr:DNA topoisomerase IV subunit A [Myxococcota bacterium]
MAQLDTLMRDHFVEYASYFILDRAIPDIRDGLKPVQRRLLHTLFLINDGRYHKVASIVGDTMKLHPHGDSSISDALVVLANKNYFIDRQGNFGDPLTGQPAAAPRYIEARLTPLAIDTLFNPHLTDFVPSYDGRNEEPVYLPSKIPVVLMLGTEGIAVGMSTKILPHNLGELWQAQIDFLNGKPVQLYPDFQQGGLMDVSAYDDGRGKVEVRAKIEQRDDKHIVIREIPYGTTTESLIASIEAAAQKGRLKVSSINDFTTDSVEIELVMSRGVTSDEVLPQLYAYTDCSVSISSNMNIVRARKPELLSVTEVLEWLTKELKVLLKAELEWERNRLLDKKHWLTLERIFVEKRVYKKIEKAATDEAVRKAVWNGMHEHENLFVREMVEDDIKRLLDIRIRRISKFDIDKNRQDIKDVDKGIKDCDRKLKNMKKTTIDYVKSLIDKYAEQYPRKTEITSIVAVDKKAVARQNIKLAYDPDSGYFGSSVKGDRFNMTVSEFDLILAIAKDGTFRVMPPPEKMLFAGKLLYCEIFDPERAEDFTIVYRDAKRIAFAKQISIEKFIRNREYTLIRDKAGAIDYLLRPDEAGVVSLTYAPAKRQRLKGSQFDLGELIPTSTTARGARLAPKPVSKIQHLGRKPVKKKGAASRTRSAGPKKSPGKAGGQGELF